MVNAHENKSFDHRLARAASRVGKPLPGGYRLLKLLAIGGFGAVYRAVDAHERLVAIKTLHDPQDEGAVASVRREYEASRRIANPGVVNIMTKGQTETGEVFLVMEYVEGETLEAKRLRSGGKLPTPDAIFATLNLLSVLETMHYAGVVHKDLKPDNIMIENAAHGRLKVIDLGMAQISRLSSVIPLDRDRMNASSYVMGTLGFMSPEQVNNGDHIDARSDIFAVGAIMHLLLTDRLVHQTTGTLEFLSRTACVQAPSILTIDPRIPKPVAAVIDKALRLDPAERFANARMMREALVSSFDWIPR